MAKVSVSWNFALNSVEEYEVIEAVKYSWTLNDWGQKTDTLVDIVQRKLGGRWSAILGKNPVNGGHSSHIKSPKFIFINIDEYWYFIWKSEC